MYDIQIMMDDINLPIKKTPKKYSTLPNYGSYQNKKTSTYQIENQIQYSYPIRLHHVIIHLIVPVMQHPFQLDLSRSPLRCFYINDNLTRTSCGIKKKSFTTIH
jgi:hypothetical protein